MDVKAKVIALIEEGGFSAAQAGERYGVATRTASRWWAQYQERGYITRKPGSGRPKASKPQQDLMLIECSRCFPFHTSKMRVADTGFPASNRTALKRLNSANTVPRRAVVKEVLTEYHRIDRVAFCHMHYNYPWQEVIFSDEKVFMNNSTGPVQVYRPKQSKRFDPEYVVQRQRSGRLSMSVWGWISGYGGGALWRIHGHMNGDQYTNILENVMLPSVRVFQPENKIKFQHDFSSVHTCVAVQWWFNIHRDDVEEVPWVPKCPDLNPIENVWAEVQRGVNEQLQGRVLGMQMNCGTSLQIHGMMLHRQIDISTTLLIL